MIIRTHHPEPLAYPRIGAFWPRASTECTVPQRAKEVVHRDSCYQPRDHGLSRRAHYKHVSPCHGTQWRVRIVWHSRAFAIWAVRPAQHDGLRTPIDCPSPFVQVSTALIVARRGGRWDASTCCDGSGVHRRQIVLRDHAVLKPFQQRTPPGPRGSPEILAQCDDDMPHACR